MKILYEWEPSDIEGGVIAACRGDTFLVTVDPLGAYGLVSIFSGKTLVTERTAVQIADDLNEEYGEPATLFEINEG